VANKIVGCYHSKHAHGAIGRKYDRKGSNPGLCESVSRALTAGPLEREKSILRRGYRYTLRDQDATWPAAYEAGSCVRNRRNRQRNRRFANCQYARGSHGRRESTTCKENSINRMYTRLSFKINWYMVAQGTHSRSCNNHARPEEYRQESDDRDKCTHT